MNRDWLRFRIFLREVAFVIAAVGGLLVLFDWLLWPVLFPHGPSWLRIAGDATGVVLFLASRAIFAGLRRMGQPKSVQPASGAERLES